MDSGILLWGLLFSSIGLGYFIYGKKQGQPATLIAGVALIVYPYAVDSALSLVLIGLFMMAIPKLISRFF